jgi:predicted DCC family thiol-disulfide oxidoreductase YuxK
MQVSNAHPVLLYDGVCGLCNRLVQFVLKHDAYDHFRFAWLQGDFAAKVLSRHGVSPQQLDTMYVVSSPGLPEERLVARSDAVVVMLGELGGRWTVLAWTLAVFPSALRDWGYNLVARNRYRIFGKYNSCPLPEPRHMRKFLDS